MIPPAGNLPFGGFYSAVRGAETVVAPYDTQNDMGSQGLTFVAIFNASNFSLLTQSHALNEIPGNNLQLVLNVDTHQCPSNSQKFFLAMQVYSGPPGIAYPLTGMLQTIDPITGELGEQISTPSPPLDDFGLGYFTRIAVPTNSKYGWALGMNPWTNGRNTSLYITRFELPC